jgi:hypothetical protein
MSSPAHGIELIVDRAQARLDGQLRDSDALDVKALGLLAVDAAALGVLIAVHEALGRLWAVPAAAFVVAGLLFLAAVWRWEADSGPDWRQFFEAYGRKSAADIARQMLSDLLATIEWNDAHSRPKSWLYDAGFVATTVGLIGAGIAGVVR